MVYNNNNIHLFSFKIRICRCVLSCGFAPAAFHVSYSQTLDKPFVGLAYYHGWKKGASGWQCLLQPTLKSWHQGPVRHHSTGQRIAWPRPAWLEQWYTSPATSSSHITLLQGRIAVKRRDKEYLLVLSSVVSLRQKCLKCLITGMDSLFLKNCCSCSVLLTVPYLEDYNISLKPILSILTTSLSKVFTLSVVVFKAMYSWFGTSRWLSSDKSACN